MKWACFWPDEGLKACEDQVGMSEHFDGMS